MIRFSRVDKTYNPSLFKPKVTGVRDLSFEIQKGEVFGLVGSNGAGKSTCIKLMLGLMRPDGGDILFDGQPLANSRFRDQIGYLPENPYLYDNLNLLELLRFGGRSYGMTAAGIAERSLLLIEKMDLAGVQRRPLRTFSKGMLQKAAICLTLLHDPSIVILDEPMSGLDPIGRRLVFDLISELNARGRTIFFCSHILNDVERLCDRIGFMHDGTLVETLETADWDRNSIHLVISDRSEPLENDLAELGATCRLDDEGHTFVKMTSSSLPSVTALLQDRNVGIIGIRREDSSLEDIFFEIVGGRHAG